MRGRRDQPAGGGGDRDSAVYLAEALRTVESRRTEVERLLKASQEKLARMERLLDLALDLELDSLFQRVLDLAAEIMGADGACLVVEGPDGALITAIRGTGEIEPTLSALPSLDGSHRAVTLRYHIETDEQAPPQEEPIRVAVVVPIPDAGSPARLALFWREQRHEPTDEALHALESLTERAGPTIDVARRYEDARRRADLDPLTGLLNQRLLQDSLERETSRARRYEHPLAVLLLDIDDFKFVNDRFGHATGDVVLVEFAKRLQSVVRGADIICRAGGDEFVVILPEGGSNDARQLYGRVRDLYAGSRFGPVERLTVSGGITELEHDDDPGSLLERADRALYQAKRTGKDNAVVAPSATDGEHFAGLVHRSDG